jgi:uncharacterized protein (DUF1499 family)
MVAAIAILGGPRVGLFSGSRPDNLGVRNGQLAPPNKRPNNVHSQIDAGDSHYIAPIALAGDPATEFARLKKIVRALDRVKVIEDRADYLYVETSSPSMGFVDDTEFLLDAAGKRVHARAAARLGIRDFDANRKRVEVVRAAMTAR